MNKLFLLIFLFTGIITKAQDSLLTLKQAVEICLQNNYEIKIAGNSFEQQKNNNTAGNAGMLPSVDFNGSYTKSSNSLKQKYNTNVEVERDASKATSLIADLGAEWTIFNGLKMFNTKEKLS